MTVRMAQWGTRHGHAAGKAQAMRRNPDVELVGVFEPDPQARAHAEGQRAYTGLRFFDRAEDLLGEPGVVAVAIEGLNAHSLPMALEAVKAGKHIWYDKPAGDDWEAFQEVVSVARRQSLVVQMGYMLRYQDGFQRLAEWSREGLLGDVFAVRAHMSNWIPVQTDPPGAFTRSAVAAHTGGILFDLGGHMLDQVLWVLQDERPARVTAYLRNDATPEVPSLADNTLAVLEFRRSLATVEIAAMEPPPPARRFEVYGTQGSAILDPLEPGRDLRLCLREARGGFAAGVQRVPLAGIDRQRSYELELEAFLPAVRGERPPDRSLDHELLVQETLLRATGRIAGPA
jgi:predicted dehydrogenase